MNNFKKDSEIKVQKFGRYGISIYDFYLYVAEKKILSNFDLNSLKSFLDNAGKIKPRAETFLKKNQHKKITKIIKNARFSGFLPFYSLVELSEKKE